LSLRVPGLYKPKALVIALAITYLLLKVSIINTPSPERPPQECIEDVQGCGFVFDEAHYIRAVRRMLLGDAANNEHPPLAKYLIMYSISALGDNPLAWRISSVVSGSVSLVVLYFLARRLTGEENAALLTSVLFALDVMAFNISSIAILDAPSLLLSLLGAYLYVIGRRLAGGAALAASILAKASAAFTALGVILYDSIINSGDERDPALRLSRLLRAILIQGLIIFTVFSAGLAVYDYQFRAFQHPFAHLDFILNYHSSLRFRCSEPHLPLYCIHRDDGDGTIVDLPLSWVLPVIGFRPMGFYVVSVTIDGYEEHPILYYGIQGPLWWLFWVVLIYNIPAGVKAITNHLRGVQSLRGGSEGVDAFITLWIVFNYLIYYPLAYLFSRWVYPFYFYFTLPVMAIAVSHLLTQRGMPRYVAWLVLGAQFIWFLTYYPVRGEYHLALLRLLGLPT